MSWYRLRGIVFARNASGVPPHRPRPGNHSRPRHHPIRRHLSLPPRHAQGGSLYGAAEGYVAPGKKDWVWRFKKGLYGLVQAGRTWNEGLNAHMESEGFTAKAKDPAIYVKNSYLSDDFTAAGY